MDFDRNPFPEGDPERHSIWEMLVHRDIEAFLRADWSAHGPDFLAGVFIGLVAERSLDPDAWRAGYGQLAAYRDDWLQSARDTMARARPDGLREALYRATILRDIDINGDFAVAHKKFNGTVPASDGGIAAVFDWQTVYLCARRDGRWWIAGFVGNLPFAAGSLAGSTGPTKIAPPASQHLTAGPYSPVIEIAPGRLVVISGQVAMDPSGAIVGADIETQARATLDNCARQLRAAGAELGDVFKVNVYLRDIKDWARFNAVYREMMAPPYPARTAVQAGLIEGLDVEIEMWAVKP